MKKLFGFLMVGLAFASLQVATAQAFPNGVGQEELSSEFAPGKESARESNAIAQDDHERRQTDSVAGTARSHDMKDNGSGMGEGETTSHGSVLEAACCAFCICYPNSPLSTEDTEGAAGASTGAMGTSP